MLGCSVWNIRIVDVNVGSLQARGNVLLHVCVRFVKGYGIFAVFVSVNSIYFFIRISDGR